MVVSVFRYIHRAPKRNYSDFHVLHTTAERFKSGEELYTYEGEVSYFKYPPFYAFLISPLSFLSEYQAALLWHLINWVFMVLIFYCLVRILNSKRYILIVLLGFIYSFRFILENLDQGQANISFLAFTVFALYFYLKDRKIASSFFLVASILFKYLSLLFLPLFILKKDYKYIMRVIFFAPLLYFSPIIITGFRRMVQLSQGNIVFLFQSSLDKYSITCYPNQSLLAAFRRLFSQNQWYSTQLFQLSDKAISIVFIAVSLMLLIIAVLPKRDLRINFGLIAILVALLNPNGWKNSFVWLLIPAMTMFYFIFEKKIKDRVSLIMLILSFVFCSLTSEFVVYSWAGDLFEIYSFITWGALMLFFGLLRINRAIDT